MRCCRRHGNHVDAWGGDHGRHLRQDLSRCKADDGGHGRPWNHRDSRQESGAHWWRHRLEDTSALYGYTRTRREGHSKQIGDRELTVIGGRGIVVMGGLGLGKLEAEDGMGG